MHIKRLVGARLRELRASLDLSQGELAERAGLGVETISRMERGVQGLTLDNLYKVVEALDVPLYLVFDVLEKKEDLVECAAISEILQMLRLAPKNQVMLALKVVRAIVESGV